jgi:hypothetical protein
VISRAHTLLKVIDAELAKTPFLAGSTPTIADIANYSYIAHAPEGNVSLEPYANVRLAGADRVAAGLRAHAAHRDRAADQRLTPRHREERRHATDAGPTPSPWHAGENPAGKGRCSRAHGGVRAKVIRDHMPDQHRTFYHQLPFMVAASVDAQGRPGRRCWRGQKGS